MPIVMSLFVLSAALLHASWNALLKAGADRLWTMAVMCVAIALVCAALAPIVAAPAPASWACICASGILHVGYNLCLVRTYRSGDLGQTYPIARGVSPLLVSLGASLFAGELPAPINIVGVLLVSGGIVSLAFLGERLTSESLLAALATGCFIGAYSVMDGVGARLSGAPIGYTVWMCLLWGVLMPLAYLLIRGRHFVIRSARETLVAAAGGLVSLVAYGIVVLAMTRAPMGPVSAFRETSVVFAALLGRVVLGERLTRHRIGACMIIASGAFCIAR